jgi:hypothetical protein
MLVRDMTRIASQPTAISRFGLFLALLGLAHILLKIVFGLDIIGLKLTGDENAYVDAAKALSNLIRDIAGFASPDIVELKRSVVGNGWFLPGMPLLLTPLYLLFPDAGIASIRIYLGCLSLILWVWAVAAAYKRLGKPYACALMVFPSLAPLWVMFSFTAWGDLYAGLVLVILLSHLFTALQKTRRNVPLSVREGIWIGALTAACLYPRSSVLPLALLVLAALLLAPLVYSKGRRKTVSLPASTAAIAAFLAILLPWSITASKTLHGPVIATTTVPLSMAVAFGNKEELCFGNCGHGNLWFRAVSYSRAIASQTNTNELVVQKSMARYATRNVTPQSYAADVLGNFRRYAFNPTSFTHVFIPRPRDAGGASAIRWSFVNNATATLYYTFMCFMLAGWLVIARRGPDTQLASILVKMFSAGMLLQPFVHVSGGRYWTVFAPLFALSLGTIVTILVGRRPATEPTENLSHGWAEHLMTWIQVTFVVLLVATVAALFLLSEP